MPSLSDLVDDSEDYSDGLGIRIVVAVICSSVEPLQNLYCKARRTLPRGLASLIPTRSGNEGHIVPHTVAHLQMP